LRVAARVDGYFGKPGARNHYAARRDEAALERLDGGGVHGVRHAEVVCVDDKELRARRVAETLGQRLRLSLHAGRRRRRDHAEDVCQRDDYYYGLKTSPHVRVLLWSRPAPRLC